MKKGKKSKPVVVPADQESWLRENYRLYNRYQLCKHLKVAEKRLTVLLKQLGLSKRNGAQITLTSEHKQFVRDNYFQLSHEQIAVKLGVAVITVQRYCNRAGLKKLTYEPPPPPKKIITFVEPVKPTRPRADHTNISREQHVNYWLNYPI
jgi:hypothetical protein